MRVQLWKNPKEKENEPDFIVMQRQRLDDGTTGYVTVQVGTGYTMEAPSGEKYIDVTIKGFNNNKPKTT